jgi:hypothetical protein
MLSFTFKKVFQLLLDGRKHMGLGQIRPVGFASLVGALILVASAPSSAEIIPPIRVKIPVVRVPSPANTWCTYDTATGTVGRVTVIFSAGYNKMVVNTCVTDTEAAGSGKIAASGKTITYFTDYYGGSTLGLNRDMYVTQIFLSASMLQKGKEVTLFQGSVGSYYRLCDEDRGAPVNNFHNGTAPTNGNNTVLAQAADKGYLIFEEHGNGQC